MDLSNIEAEHVLVIVPTYIKERRELPHHPSHHPMACLFSQSTPLFHFFLNPAQVLTSAILPIPKGEKTLLTVSKPSLLKRLVDTPLEDMVLLRCPISGRPDKEILDLLPRFAKPAPLLKRLIDTPLENMVLFRCPISGRPDKEILDLLPRFAKPAPLLKRLIDTPLENMVLFRCPISGRPDKEILDLLPRFAKPAPLLKRLVDTPLEDMVLLRCPISGRPDKKILDLLPRFAKPAPLLERFVHTPFSRALLINLHTPNHPVSILKRLRILPYIILTARCLGLATFTRTPCSPRPVPAEGDVEDDVEILEVLINLAPAREFRNRHPPFGRIRLTAADILGYVRAGEMVHADIVARPGCSPDTTATLIHPLAKSLHAPLLLILRLMPDPTPHVLPLARRVHIAIRRFQFPAVPSLLDRATGGSMQCHFVMPIVVGAFENIDLAADGPFARI